MRVFVVIGTRPEAIKLWPVAEDLRRAGAEVILCSTGQHRDLLVQVLPVLGLSPDINLPAPRTHLTPEMLAAVLTPQIAAEIERSRPNWVVVQGDTTSALAGARAAIQARVQIAHVEAGLRTFDPLAPWPEELNRCEITRHAHLHFAPTPKAAQNLRNEGVSEAVIVITGNTVVDSLQRMRGRLDSSPALRLTVEAELAAIPTGKRLVLVTGHRRENIRAGLDHFAQGLAAIAARGDVEIVLPVHPNPAIRSFAAKLRGVAGITTTPPLSYPACLTIMQRCALLITDSGGLQEEAPALGLPMLVTRISTERPEALDCGAGRLTKMEDIAPRAFELLDDPVVYDAMAKVRFPFGEGQASERIVKRLLHQRPPKEEYVRPSFSAGDQAKGARSVG